MFMPRNLPQRGERDCRGGIIAAFFVAAILFIAVKAGFKTGFFDFWISFFKQL